MRFSYLVITGLLLSAPVAAQEMAPAAPPDASLPGPVVGGKHRQPTQSEIDARQRAEGQSAQQIDEKNKRDQKTLEELYRELTTGTPPAKPAGTP